MTLPSAAKVTSQFLFSTDERPGDITAEGAVINREAGVVRADVNEFMQTGAGRFALGWCFDLVRAFFTSPDLNNTTGQRQVFHKPQLTQSFGLYTAQLVQHQYDLSDGRDDYAERTYIFNTEAYNIGEQAEFVVEADGRRHIEHFSVTPAGLRDNFDFVGHGLPALAGNDFVLRPRVDPSAIGKTVSILFTGSVIERNYELSDYVNDARTANTWEIGPVAHLLPDMLALLDTIESTYTLLQGGRPVVFGTDEGETLNAQRWLGDEQYGTAANTGAHVVAGAGNDRIFIEFAHKAQVFSIHGDAGDDTIDASGSSEGYAFGPSAQISLDSVEHLIASSGPDKIAYAPGLLTIAAGGGSDKVVLRDGAPGLQIDGGAGDDTVSYSGISGPIQIDFALPMQTGPNAFALARAGGVDILNSVEKLILTNSDDRVLLAQDQSGDPLSWLKQIDGAGGFDIADFGAFTHSVTGALAWGAGTHGGIRIDINLLGILSGESYPVLSDFEEVRYTAYDDQIRVEGAGTRDALSYTPTLVLDGGAGNDRFEIGSAGGALPVILLGGSGQDVFSLQGYDASSAGFTGKPPTFVVMGGDGDDTLDIAGSAQIRFMHIASEQDARHLDVGKLAAEYQQSTDLPLVIVLNAEEGDSINLNGHKVAGASAIVQSSSRSGLGVADGPLAGARGFWGGEYGPENIYSLVEQLYWYELSSSDGFQYHLDDENAGRIDLVTVIDEDRSDVLEIVGVSEESGMVRVSVPSRPEGHRDIERYHLPSSTFYKEEFLRYFDNFVFQDTDTSFQQYYSAGGYADPSMWREMGVSPKLSMFEYVGRELSAYAGHSGQLTGPEELDALRFGRPTERYGSDDDDLLLGGMNDVLFGAAGNDTYRLSGGTASASLVAINPPSLSSDPRVLRVVEGAFEGTNDTVDLSQVAGVADLLIQREFESDSVNLLMMGADGSVILSVYLSGEFAGEESGVENVLLPGGTRWSKSELKSAYFDQQSRLGEFWRLGFSDSDLIHSPDGGGSVRGGGGDDELVGGAGVDYLDGGSERDRIYGGEGADFLTGGEGADTFVYEAASDSPFGGNDVITDFQSGLDKLDFTALGAGSAVAINLGAGLSTVYYQAATGPQGVIALTGLAAGSDLLLDPSAQVFIAGSPWADVIRGSARNDHLNGGAGDDRITGGLGADVLTGAEGRDTFVFTSVSDSPFGANDAITDFQTGLDKLDFTALGAGSAVAINLGAGLSTVYYQAATGPKGVIGVTGLVSGSDLLLGAGAQVFIAGSPGADVIGGSAGDDHITGGLGADVLTGGAGADTFAYAGVSDSPSGAGDTITDFETNRDRIDLTGLGAGAAVAINLGSGYSNLYYQIAAGGPQGQITVPGLVFGTDLVMAPGAQVWINGGAQTDIIYGTNGADTIDGGPGDDHIAGQLGADTLTGGAGPTCSTTAAPPTLRWAPTT